MELKGLIYCRVSSLKQVKEGNGLSSQEKRCRDYAKNVLGIEVEKIFNEEGVSGGLFERKSIKELFKYIDSNKKNNYIVIFEDLNRLSRDIQVHSLLKAEFKKRGVELACPNFQFDESPEGDFKENISVVVSQYEKDKNRQRIISRMKAKLEQGFWCLKNPLGYKFVEAPNGGKVLVWDEPKAKIIKSGLESFAKGNITNLTQLGQLLFRKGLRVTGVNNEGKVVSKSGLYRLTTNILYMGYLECKKFGVAKVKAEHKPLISEKTYNKIQERLKSKSHIKRYIEENIQRNDISNDFPLRGLLYCEKSKNMLSGGWSQGKTTKVAYYRYPLASPMKGKSLNRNKFHTYFDDYLKEISPNEDLIEAFQKTLENELKLRNKDKIQYKETLKKEIKQIDNKISAFIERISNTESEVLIKNYEEKIEELEKEKVKKNQILSEDLKNVGTGLKRKLKTFKNAFEIWKSSNLENKKILLKNIFPEGIPINEKKQVGTPAFSLIYQAFNEGKKSKNHLVELKGKRSNYNSRFFV